MKKQQPQVEEAFNLSSEIFDDKYLLTLSPEKKSEGFVPTSIIISPEQYDSLLKQIKSGVAFRFMMALKDGKIELSLSADKINIDADYNFQTIEISQEQWDGLRYSFMAGINDSKGLTKLCYLQ